MAKAETPRIKGIVVQRKTIAQPEVNIKSYVDLLWVVGAGVIGVSLLCVTAAVALANPNTSTILQSQSIIQIAIANVSTAAALTVEAFPQNLITPTLAPSNTQAASSQTSSATVTSVLPTATATRIFVSKTNTPRPRLGGQSNTNPFPLSSPTWVPTQISSPLPPPTFTSSPIPSPTITNTPAPTRTPRPTRTRTPVPSPTDTSAPPPTDTSAPPPTNTFAPPTDTSAPPPTNTFAPPPTDTSAPPPTDTPAADVPTATPGP